MASTQKGKWPQNTHCWKHKRNLVNNIRVWGGGSTMGIWNFNLETSWAGHVARMVEERGVYRVLLVKPEGRRPPGRPRRRWVDNIRMDFQEVGCGYMDWIGLVQDRDRWRTLVSAVMNLRVPWNAGNFLTSCKPVNFSRRTLHHGVSY